MRLLIDPAVPDQSETWALSGAFRTATTAAACVKDARWNVASRSKVGSP